MDQHHHSGGCHCGALRFELATRLALRDLAPRACDCDHCTRHAAAWVSDPQGHAHIRGSSAASRYRQGSAQAEFLLCPKCGVLVAVAARIGEAMRCALNRNAFDGRMELPAGTAASPQHLAPEEKRERWAGLWTPATLE